MRLPRFTAEFSLDAAAGRQFQGEGHFESSGTAAVVPMLDDLCGNCETVGGLGGIHGVGRRSCCRKVVRYDPLTKRYTTSWDCRFESCTPGPTTNQSFRF